VSRRWLLLLLALLPAVAWSVAALPAVANVRVELPRPFGYRVGDVLQQALQLQIDGKAVELPELPRKEKIGVWLLRRGATLENRADGTRWLKLDYQIINASRDVDVIALPALHLRTGDPQQFIDVPEWPLSVSAITPQTVSNRGGLIALRPDRAAPQVAVGAVQRRMQLSLLGVLVTLALWLGWWRLRNWQAEQRLPFAQALRTLRRLPPEAPEAWRCLHRAFDASAGQVLHIGSLPVLFQRAPHYQPLQAEIEAFYAQSTAYFFGAGISGGMGNAALGLSALCRKLRRIEKSHER